MSAIASFSAVQGSWTPVTPGNLVFQLQNQLPGRLFLFIGQAPPTDTTPPFTSPTLAVLTGGSMSFTLESGDLLYVRSELPTGGGVIFRP